MKKLKPLKIKTVYKEGEKLPEGLTITEVSKESVESQFKDGIDLGNGIVVTKDCPTDLIDKLLESYPAEQFLKDMLGKPLVCDLPLFDGDTCEDLYKDYLPPQHGRFNCRGDYIWPNGEISRKEAPLQFGRKLTNYEQSFAYGHSRFIQWRNIP